MISMRPLFKNPVGQSRGDVGMCGWVFGGGVCLHHLPVKRILARF